jgi:hypothetical protein
MEEPMTDASSTARRVGPATAARLRMTAGTLAAIVMFAARVAFAADDRGWLGIYSEPVSPLPAIEAAAGGEGALLGARTGLRVTAVFPHSPAERGGLLVEDIIVAIGGHALACPPESAQAVLRGRLEGLVAGARVPLRIVRREVVRRARLNGAPLEPRLEHRLWRDMPAVVDSLVSGDSLAAGVGVRQAIVEIAITLGRLPSADWPQPRANDQIFTPGRLPASDFTPLAWALAESAGVRVATEDLLARLARCHAGADPYRLDAMIYAHRDPFRLEALARRITRQFGEAPAAAEAMPVAGELLDPARAPQVIGTLPPVPAQPWPAGDLAAFWETVDRVYADARAALDRAFAGLTPEERAFMEAKRWQLTDRFAEDIYIHLDEDRDRFEENDSLITLAARIDYPELLRAAQRLATLSTPEWARAAGAFLRATCADSLDREIVITRLTPHGRMLIGGTAAHWYRDTDAAFILDLGGDDFYSGNNGGSSSAAPLALAIDLAGNDAYESTTRSAQGAGCLGVGGLLDLEGSDEYIALQWCQGVGYAGVGWLDDRAGDDTYRGRTFCQAVGLFGLGLLIDGAGNDRYEGDAHVQGVGLPRGIGALIERGGNDEYYAKGLYPTSYGDAGIFDAWSQGCGTGFRTVASGGLGLLLDAGGSDRMEAGNFSQGGGYYYGFGILEAGGDANDTYVGSRYNQGFSAHQALGVFLEAGGNDVYTTRQAVAQGLAWDECVTLFIDAAGDDVYEGGGGFSQGASAHNSFSFFLDRGGCDTYRYAPGQAGAGGNDYHGGTSFSLFIDEGGARDIYTASGARNTTIRYAPEHGFAVDLDGTLERALRAIPPLVR